MQKVAIPIFRIVELMIGVFLLTGSAGAQSTQDSSEAIAFIKRLDKTNVSQDSNPTITLKLDQVPLEEALKRIAEQAEAGLYYNAALLPKKTVSLSLQAVPLDQALRKVLAGTSLRIVTSGRNITLRQKREPHPMQLQLPLAPIQETISGTVTDAQSGETLPGVNILVKGTTMGTSTGSQGNFELTVEGLQDTLVVSYIGYQTKEVPINGRTEIDIALQPQTIAGEELVVVGYGTQKKQNLTGSITQISGVELSNRGLSNPIEGLEGQIPGLNVTASGEGGRPGATQNFNIRGIGSLSGGSPYVLVDGVPQDLSTIDPQAIESISVLKDAAASAIYGARAPYGVILVTTKKGSAKGGVDISYSTHIGWDAPTVVPNKVNSLQWAQTLNQAALNGGQSRLYSDETLQRMKQYIQDPESIPATRPAETNPNRWAMFNGPDLGYTANANTDLYDFMLKDWAMNQTHHLSVRGGNKSITYYLAGGMFKRNGQMRYTTNSFTRYNLTANTHTDVTNWLGLDINLKYTNRYINMPRVYGGASGGRYFFSMARRPPNEPIYDPNGHILSRLVNTTINGGQVKTNRNTFLGSVKAEINPLPGWNIHGDFSSRLNYRSVYNHKKKVVEYAVDESTYPLSNTIPTEYAENKNESLYQTYNIYTSYQIEPGKHFFEGMIGFQSEDSHYSYLNGRRTDLLTDQVPSISTAAGIQYAGDAKGHWATKGIFARLQYNYDQKYLIEFNGRYDGSSRFDENNRWGFFPSVSVGYNIAREPFWKGLREEVNLLKIRGSYGSLGNHDVANYLYLSTLRAAKARWIIGNEQPDYVSAPGLISSSLTWETANTLNLGLDVEMLESRLSLTFDWFQRRTLNMFGPAKSYPSVLGTSPPRRNNANLRTRGFELSLGWSDQIGQVQYNVDLHLADHQSVVTKYRNENGVIYDYYVGQELGEIWGYTTEGLYSSEEAARSDPVDQSFLFPVWNAGDINYKDLNGDGKINNGNRTLDDHGDLSIIGNSTPRYTYSIDLGLRWKGFNFSMLWQGVAKRDLWLNGAMFWGPSNGNQPQRNGTILKEHLDAWSSNNKDAYYPIPYLSGENNKNTQTQTRYLQNGAYLRLKMAQVSYTFPQKWLSKLNVKKLQIYLEGENLLTFSPIMEAFDPEATGSGPTGVSPGQIYPLARTLAVGLNISL